MEIPSEKNSHQKPKTSSGWIATLLPTLVIAKDYEATHKNDLYPKGSDPQWEKEPESQEYIRFTDCDPFGHLNNGKYIDYFMNARDLHLRTAYGVDLATHSIKHQANWLVKEHRISYLRPAKLKEQIRIRSRLLGFSQHETLVESIMLDQEGRQIKALLWSHFSYVNLYSGRVTSHPEYIQEILRATKIESKEFLENNFEGRSRAISTELRAQFLKQKP